MHIHILGICGTFMAGIAVLAKQQGHHVTGADQNVYPPMSTQLAEQGIVLFEGYDVAQLNPAPDMIVVGNAMKRGNPCVEYMLEQGLRYTSGPQWLAENVLQERWVLAVAGTHGKTTTTSLLAWILEDAGLQPGFLIGGIAKNFAVSARLGENFFVIEADEYDTAFFDKRSKFIHYHPRTLILNNLEFDHADIFANLEAIQTQFHHLIRTVPGNGLIIYPPQDANLQTVLAQGCWTPAREITNTAKNVLREHLNTHPNWNLLGEHNLHNAFAALAAAQHVGVLEAQAKASLVTFQGVKRRMEVLGQLNQAIVYDDFAHHPTAIATTLDGLRQQVGSERIIAVVELGSYTMRTGVHRDALLPALQNADHVLILRPQQDWGVDDVAQQCGDFVQVHDNITELVQALLKITQPQNHVLIMSNTGFAGLRERLKIHFDT